MKRNYSLFGLSMLLALAGCIVNAKAQERRPNESILKPSGLTGQDIDPSKGQGLKLQPPNTIRVAVRYKKEYGYKSNEGLVGPGPSSYSAFKISAKREETDYPRDPILISNDGRMRDSGGFYSCDYLVSDVPLNESITITIGLADERLTPFEKWKGGSQPQPPRGYRRVILDATQRVKLTRREPSASIVFEMVYDLPPLTSRPPLSETASAGFRASPIRH